MKVLAALKLVFLIIAMVAFILAIVHQSLVFVFGFLTFSWATYTIHNSINRVKKKSESNRSIE